MQGAVQSCITCRVQYAVCQSTWKSFRDASEMHWKSAEFDMQGCTLTQIPKSVKYFFSMMRSEHHTGMHSFHNILISKSALVSLNNCKEKFTFFPKQNKSKQQKNAFCYTFNVRTIISTKLMKEHTESTVRRGHGDAPHFGGQGDAFLNKANTQQFEAHFFFCSST